jgi:hypothetical protein
LRGIIVSVPVGAMKIYVAAVEVLKKIKNKTKLRKPSILMVF